MAIKKRKSGVPRTAETFAEAMQRIYTANNGAAIAIITANDTSHGGNLMEVGTDYLIIKTTVGANFIVPFSTIAFLNYPNEV